jgi:DNA repair exonuclease SbcCD ATPase subunit
MKLYALTLIGSALLCLAFPARAQNQGKAKAQSTQQAKQELDAAKDKLKDANQDLGKAEKEAEKTEAAHKAAVAKIQKARQTALAEQGKKLGLPAALAQRDAAERAVSSAHATLAKEIRAQADYQAAAKEAEKASARLQEAREDTTLAEEKKKALTTELSKTIRRPVELERERIEADAGLQQLRLKAAEAGKQVATIQAQAAKAAEDDTEVRAAQQAEHAAAVKVKDARAEVDKRKNEVATAQKKAASEQQQLQKAQAQSQTKNKKGKNDK